MKASNALKLVFMGTPEFAVPSLKALNTRHHVVAVVTAADKPSGRGQKLTPSPVKQAAQEAGIPVLQPEKLKSAEFIRALRELNADLFVVVAFRMLPEEVWSMPPRGTINLHASLLPQYRGAAPINRAIMNGETTTGLTTFFIEKEIDTGNVIEQVELPIGGNETAGELHDRMMEAGAALLLRTVNAIAADEAASKPQSTMVVGTELRAAPKIFREDCTLHWNLPAQKVHNHIRGLSPYPGAVAHSADLTGHGEPYKILQSALTGKICHERPGNVHIEGSSILVATADEWLEIRALQAPGRRRMNAAEFLNGWRKPVGFTFTT